MNHSKRLEVSLRGYLNDSPTDFDRLFRIWKSVSQNKNSDVEFQFRGSRFLRQNAIAFIGGLTRLIQQSNRKVFYNLDGLPSNVRNHLETNGFFEQFKIGSENKYVKSTSIPFRIDQTVNNNGFTTYLRDRWLSGNRVNLSNALKDAIITNVIEAYVNVFHHADSPIGVATCGQFFPNRNDGELVITMVDFGIGIPSNVRRFLDQPTMKASQALSWAFQPGATTKRNDAKNISRGLGLKELKQFVEINNGKLEIYSGNGYVKIDRNGKQVTDRSIVFEGTIVQISLRCDAHYYTLDEMNASDDKPLF